MRLVLWVIVVMSFFFHRSICNLPSPNQNVVCQLVVRVQKEKKKESESESESESKSESASPSGSQDWGQPQP